MFRLVLCASLCVTQTGMIAWVQKRTTDLSETSLEALMNIEVASVSKEQEKLSQTAAAIIEENKVRLEINMDAAARAGLKISSKLLAVARVVPDERRGGKG